MIKYDEMDINQTQLELIHRFTHYFGFRNWDRVTVEQGILAHYDSNGFYHGPRIHPDGSYEVYDHGTLHSGRIEFPALRHADGTVEFYFRGFKTKDYSELLQLNSLYDFHIRNDKYKFSLQELTQITEVPKFRSCFFLISKLDLPKRYIKTIYDKYSYRQVVDMWDTINALGIASIHDAPEPIQTWFGLDKNPAPALAAMATLAITAAITAKKKEAKHEIK